MKYGYKLQILPAVIAVALWCVQLIVDVFNILSWFNVGKSVASSVLMSACTVSIVAIVAVVCYTLQVRLNTRLDQARGRLCTKCRYNLSDLAAQGACPECGQRYLDHALVQYWRSGYRVPWFQREPSWLPSTKSHDK